MSTENQINAYTHGYNQQRAHSSIKHIALTLRNALASLGKGLSFPCKCRIILKVVWYWRHEKIMRAALLHQI